MKIIEKILSENLPIDNDTFIFDIETTGLNPKFCKIILIGILYNCQDKTIIKQFFAENENDEKELLTKFVDEIRDLKKHNIDFSLNKEDDFDIFKFVKSFKIPLGLESCSLTNVEKYFGIHREDIINGEKSIKLYEDFIENQNKNIMDTILLHNYEDVYNLSKLINIKDLVKEKLDLLEISNENYNLSIFPITYKLNSKKLIMNYFIFSGEHNNISIYNDNYSIICEDDNISLEININKGIDRENNTILFYSLSKIIPLKFNDQVLEKNIYSLCNFLIKNELNNI